MKTIFSLSEKGLEKAVVFGFILVVIAFLLMSATIEPSRDYIKKLRDSEYLLPRLAVTITHFSGGICSALALCCFLESAHCRRLSLRVLSIVGILICVGEMLTVFVNLAGQR